MKQYWLIKSEADCYSIDQFEKDSKRLKKVPWTGIRNYQARNYMRDSMKAGDGVLFYHSGKDPAVVGVAKVVGASHPDMTAQDKKDEHYDPKSTSTNPIWMCVDVAFVKKFKTPVTLSQIKFQPELKGIMLTQIGNRLSVQPVSKAHFEKIVEMGNK